MKVFIIKVSNEAVIRTILKFTPFIHDGIYLFENEIKVGMPVFIYFGGDKSQITWDQGLKACGIITKAPFDKGYSKDNVRYFKIEVTTEHILDEAIPPKDSKIHKKLAEDLYDVPYVGANHFPNQAIAKTEVPESIMALVQLYEEKATVNLSNLRKSLNLEIIPDARITGQFSFQDIAKSFSKAVGEAKLNLDYKLIARFISALCAKPFVILTGLSGSGKTKLAQAFAYWITEEPAFGTQNRRFSVGEKVISSRVIYEATATDSISVTFTQTESGTKVTLPYELVEEWIYVIKEKGYNKETSPRTIRDAVEEKTSYSPQQNSFETHLKAAAFNILERPNIKNSTIYQYTIVPVGADWTNSEPLLGYPNALEEGKYIKPENGVVDLLIEACKTENSDKPYFLILDEMNLSHVERYFADFLSAMESKEFIHLHSGDTEWDGVPPKLRIPENLFIIGTVNIDETTYMFSPKVLDRANVIDFSVSDNEMKSFLKNPAKPDMSSLNGAGSSMSADFMHIAKTEITDFTEADGINPVLLEFFNELKKLGAEFGYRAASEIYRFAGILNKLTENEEEKWNLNDIIDAAIMQKLLPKVHGSRSKLEPILKTLAGLCREEDEDKILFPLSLEKIERMRKRVVQDGFTSFAEA